jgi:hypothetical protein
MPGSYKLDVERRIVFSRAWGVVVDEDIAAHPKALRADPRFSPDFNQIADFRDVLEYRLTSDGIRNQVHLNPFSSESRRVIIVAPGVGFGLARMYQSSMTRDSDMFQIVHTLEEGNEWIGLGRDAAWPEGPADAVFGVNEVRGATAR